MTDPDFGVAVTVEDGATVVAVSGEVDLYTGPLLWERLSAVIETGSPRVVLDLKDMRFIDSTGVSVVVLAMRALQQRGGQLVLRSPCRMASKLLELTGLSNLLEIQDDVAVAV
ncbi:MAG: STAS domain-containing protein [Actinomycetota bacterium]|nr:STAS domain-containing protein [Actinomycetota bacterium]